MKFFVIAVFSIVVVGQVSLASNLLSNGQFQLPETTSEGCTSTAVVTIDYQKLEVVEYELPVSGNCPKEIMTPRTLTIEDISLTNSAAGPSLKVRAGKPGEFFLYDRREIKNLSSGTLLVRVEMGFGHRYPLYFILK